MVYTNPVHGDSHTDGSDDIQDATSAQKGVATAAQITKLDGVEALSDVTANAGAFMDSEFINQSFQNLLKNSSFSSWSAGDNNLPDSWLKARIVATYPKQSTDRVYGTFSASLLWDGDGTEGVIWTLLSENDSAGYAGKVITLGAWVKASVADSVKISIFDGVDTTLSVANTGADWEFLSVSHTVNAGVTYIRAQVKIYDSINVVRVDGVSLIEGLLSTAFYPKSLIDDGKTVVIDSVNNQVTVCGLEVEGGIVFNRVTVAAATYTPELSDSIVGVTYTATGAVTITISSAHIAIPGKYIRVVDEGGNASAHNITIATEGAETISGAGTQTINTDYGRLRIYTDGTNCFLS